MASLMTGHGTVVHIDHLNVDGSRSVQLGSRVQKGCFSHSAPRSMVTSLWQGMRTGKNAQSFFLGLSYVIGSRRYVLVVSVIHVEGE